MVTRYLLSAIILLSLLTPSSSWAVPPPGDAIMADIDHYIKPFWQDGSSYTGLGGWGCDKYGGKGIVTPCKKTNGHYYDTTIGAKGCAITSLTMLYWWSGMTMMLDENHDPIPGKWLHPGNLDDWMVDHQTYTTGPNVEWIKTTSKFYMNDYSPYYNATLKLTPNYCCDSSCKTKDFNCFWVNNNWSGFNDLLNNDTEEYRPDIMEISYFDSDNIFHKSHFVVVGGYHALDKEYRDYDPGRHYDLPARGFNIRYNGYDKYDFKKILRFKSVNSSINNMSLANISIHSPVDIQVIDPNGRRTGFEPETRANLHEEPMALYYEDQPISSLDGDDEQGESYKRLTIVEPIEGNYILKLFGTGDGPYTIDVEWIKSDGTPNLATSLTGTATSSLFETYRVVYSPTGEASLSQTNQAPIANAGSAKTGEQTYEITLDGSASSDPDGDPMTYTWSFISKPNNSRATLSDSHAIKPTFTPDLPGTYMLQLVVNDHFTDSVPATVTITANPLKSRISVISNFSTPLSAGASSISFDVTNIGRIGVNSGIISVSLVDPDGAVVYSGNQTFSSGVGGTTTISVPVTIPPLKFGNYTLIYTQSDETRTGTPSSVSVPNNVLISTAFDKPSYRVRETANLTIALVNTGKFNLDVLSLTVSVADTGFTEMKNISLRVNDNSTQNYFISLPLTMTAGQHSANITASISSGSLLVQNTKLTVPQSSLAVQYLGPTNISSGDAIQITVENSGGVDTSYATEKLVLKDSGGVEINLPSLSSDIIAGERKNISVQLPSQIIKGYVTFLSRLKDIKTGLVSSLNTQLFINGLDAALTIRTDKDVYLNSELITALNTLSNGNLSIENGSMDVKVIRYREVANQGFTSFIPKIGSPFQLPYNVATGPDGSVYVADAFGNRIKKFDRAGAFITEWGGYGTSNGQFNSPTGIAVGPDNYIYVVDGGNYRIQKFDGAGTFITKWGGYGSSDGQFNWPADYVWDQGKWKYIGPIYQGSVAVAIDGTIYVADTNNNRVQKFDSSGTFIKKWGTYGISDGQFNGPTGIAVGSGGSVYVADTNNSRIEKFDNNGNFIAKWGSEGSSNGQFGSPAGVAVGSDGSVYIADTGNWRIQKFDNSGTYITKWGISGVFSYQPTSLAVGQNGSVYVADPGNLRIQQFDANGIAITIFGQFLLPNGVAVGSDGSIYVADTDNDRIQKFTGNGALVTSWGGSGSGDGQLNYPQGIAVGPDGSVYVADTNNYRIQKFDSSGMFITKWGNVGWPEGVAVSSDGSVYVSDSGIGARILKFDGSGTLLWSRQGWGFQVPEGVAVGPDGSVYVADTYNHRIQKFDSSGAPLMLWGSRGTGDGQFSYPASVAVAPDGSVYVTDSGNYRIQKFNDSGTFLAKWGGVRGSGNGQFSWAYGITVGPEGSVYVADTGNNRIQKMLVLNTVETLFDTTLPVAQDMNTVQEYQAAIGSLNTTGKFYLQATLNNSLGQTMEQNLYPFYIFNGNTILSYSTDKQIYKHGDTVRIAGEVRNLATIQASNLTLALTGKAQGGQATSLYNETFNLDAGSSHSFVAVTTAGAEGSVMLDGIVTQNTSTLVQIVDQYQVVVPKASLTVTAPDIVNKNPFNLIVQITNTGKVDASMQYKTTNSQGTVIDMQQITIPAGGIRIFSYERQITQSSIYSVTLTGDVTQAVTKTVSYGEYAAITIAPGSSFYPEGAVSIPVTVTNTGWVDESITVTYSLSPSAASQSKTYFLPSGGSITDTLAFDVLRGAYQLTASSLLPSASASASFTVAKDSDVSMVTTAGIQGSNGLIPVTANITNSGYSSLSGSIAIAVMDNNGKAVWRGEAPVAGLSSQASMNSVINVDSTGLLPGAYATTVTLYGSSGQQLAFNQTQVRTLGPIFEIASVPANPTFTQGTQAAFAFSVKNSGSLAGMANLSVQAANLLTQSVSNSLQPGEQKLYAFNFMVPEDQAASSYPANYALASSNSQGTTGQFAFNVAAVNFGVTATLDKQVYNNGDTAVLNLAVAKQSQFDDGTFIAIIRYGSYHDMQTFTSSGQPATLSFNVPLGTISGDRLFYGIYFLSGTRISQSSIHINTAPIVTVVSPAANSVYYSTISIAAVVSDGGLGISTVQYQVDGGQWSSLPLTDPSGGVYSTIWTTTPSDNGTHAVTFRAADTVGNMSLPVTIGFTVQVDTTPPTGSIMINNGEAYTNDPVVTLNLGCTDAESGCAQMQFSYDNVTWSTPEAYGTPKAWTFASGDGPKTVYVKYTDAVGNPSEPYSAGITLDTIPPVAVIAGTPASPTSNTGAQLTVIGADVIAYKYRLDNGTYSAETLAATPITLAGLMDGSHLVSALGKDSAGNWQKDEHATVVTWTVDTEAPVLTLSSLADGAFTNDNTLNIAGTVTDNNGVSGVTINSAAVPLNADGTFSQVISLITGSNSITTIAKDLAGNTTTDVRTIILNQSAPIINITHPSDNSVTNDSSTAVTGAVDKTASVGIKINNTSPLPEIVTDSTFSFPITYVYGQNTIEVTAIDPAGNIGTAKRTVMFDNINPALAVTNPAQDMTTNQSSILLQGTVADPTITSVTITCDGITSTPTVINGTFERQLTFSEEKTYAIVVTDTDAAGNISTVQRNIIYFKTPLYSFYGFFSPVDNPPSLNTANSGQAIPVKWRITDANGEPISDSASFKSLTSYSVNCDSFSGESADTIEEYAAGSSGLQYLGDGNWQFNWTTSKTYAQQCRMMVLTLGDNSTHIAHFKFNK